MLIDTPEEDTRTALAPDLRKLDERSARAWTEQMAVRHLGGAEYAVDSQSGATYVANLAERTCTCPDHEIRDQQCKHLRRVALEITSRRVPPPGHARAVCDACGTETFVDEDASRPHLCDACYIEPGDVVQDRETGDRLVVQRVTDERAEDVRIDAADCTVAEYATNRDYPADDLVIEVSYLSDLGRERQRAYSFPLSRLAETDDAALVA